MPEYKSLRSVINRTINKNLQDIKEWDEIPNEHEFYKTISGKDFLVKKDANFILFQSQSQALLHLHYKEYVFCDATFYSAPSLSYQLLITIYILQSLIHILLHNFV